MTTRILSRTAQVLRNQSIFSFRRTYSSKTIKENDVVLLQRKVASKGAPLLTKPLVPNTKIPIPHSRDFISTDDIIGKEARDLVSSRFKRQEYRIFQPSLAKYTDLTPRLVTPIYSQDAAVIVNLLDLHPTVPDPHERGVENTLEIFEAGTGHGSLTLHLARAIHGANNRPPPLSDYSLAPSPVEQEPSEEVARKLELLKRFSIARFNIPFEHMPETDQVYDQFLADYIKVAGELGAKIEFSMLAQNPELPEKARERFAKLAETEGELPEQNIDVFKMCYERDLNKWREQRRAVVHTLDISEQHSKHAEGVVKNFRQGIYAGNVDFHVGTIEDYLTPRLEEIDDPFLDHAILDLPATHTYLDLLGKCLKPDGSLITWNPNITQVLSCVETVREKKLPFILEKVLEMGSGGGTGGREWDIRGVRPKVPRGFKIEGTELPRVESDEVAAEDVDESGSETAEPEATPEAPQVDDMSKYEVVCRPKVGLRIEGGGFVGLWRRMEQY